MKHRPPRPPNEAVPNQVCEQLFTGGKPHPYAVVLLERMLAANAGRVVLSDAEARAVDRFVLVTEAQSAARTHAKWRGRKVILDRVLEARCDAVILVLLWRTRRSHQRCRYGVQVVRQVDGVLTMFAPTRGLDEHQALTLWHHTPLLPPRPAPGPIQPPE